MALEPGDDYDCPACGATHRVEHGKDLQVPGSSEPLGGDVYVRCPEAGVFDPAEKPPDAGNGADADGREWP